MPNTYSNSRISRKTEKRSKQIMIVSIVGILLVIIFMLKFGIPLLINFSLLLGGKAAQAPSANNSPTYIAAPILNPTFTATNSAQISVSGVASTNETVDLYVNDKKTDSKGSKSDGTFEFKNVTLTDGSNTIKVKAKSGKNTSDFSDGLSVSYKNSPVALSVDSPHDGDSFSKDQNSVIISGKTDPDARVTVNDFWAIVDDKGNYTYNLRLQNGDNQIKVIATDPAGNKTENDLKVNYSP